MTFVKRGLFGDAVKPENKYPCILIEAAPDTELVLEGARADDVVGLRAVFFDAPLTLDGAKVLANDLANGALAASVTSGRLAESALPAGTRHFLANESLLASEPVGFPVVGKVLLFGRDDGPTMFASIKLREHVVEGSPAE